MSEKKNLSKPEKIALGAIALNFFLTVIKFILAGISGSLALLAEAFHSFADIGSSGAVFLAIRLEKTPPSPELKGWKKFFYTYPQLKVAFAIGIFLLLVSVAVFRRVFRPEPIVVRYPLFTALVMLGLALASYLLSRFERVVGERESSLALIADGHHALVDMFGSLLVASGLFGEALNLRLDRPVAFIISLFIALQALNVFVVAIRDWRKKEESASYRYPQYLIDFFQKQLPEKRNQFMLSLAKKLKFSGSESEQIKRAENLSVLVVLLLIILLWFLSGIYFVAPYQKAVVERLGSPLKVQPPIGAGIHYALPFPIDRVRKIDALRVRRTVIGTEVSPESRMLLWTNIHYLREHNVLTGDRIFVDCGLVVHWRISDPYQYLYGNANPERLLESVAYQALLKEFAQKDFFQILIYQRRELEEKLFEEIRKAMKQGKSGIEVLAVDLRDIHPPTTVAPDFEEVVSAMVDYQTFINQAIGYENGLIPRTRGEAIGMLNQAKANRALRVLQMKGEKERLRLNHRSYKFSPFIYKPVVWLEAVEQVLAGKEKYLVPPEAAEGALELYLMMEPGRIKVLSSPGASSPGGRK